MPCASLKTNEGKTISLYLHGIQFAHYGHKMSYPYGESNNQFSAFVLSVVR